jgi:hypothetical protein
MMFRGVCAIGIIMAGLSIWGMLYKFFNPGVMYHDAIAFPFIVGELFILGILLRFAIKGDDAR